MCRLAAYLGPDLALKQFLLEPEHSLFVQSYDSHELQRAKLNADGFGVGWYGPDGRPAAYLNQMPIWSDVNLPHLAGSLSSRLWMTMVRSATPGYASGLANTQPFCQDGLLFSHNGYIEGFDQRLRGQVRRELSTEIEADIKGNTDSEHLFALIRQRLSDDAAVSLPKAMGECLRFVEEGLSDGTALLNLQITDGQRIYTTRHALNSDCPSLYYTTDDEHFPDNAQIAASERLTDNDFWQPVPEHHLLVLDPNAPPELIAL